MIAYISVNVSWTRSAKHPIRNSRGQQLQLAVLVAVSVHEGRREWHSDREYGHRGLFDMEDSEQMTYKQS